MVEDSRPPVPPGPPGPPTHVHDDGAHCMWVRHNGVDRWRRVSATGWDDGPCPQLDAAANGGAR